MSINTVNVSTQTLISNAQHVGRQTEVVKKSDLKPQTTDKGESSHHMDDMVNLSDTLRNEGKAGEKSEKAKGSGNNSSELKEQKEDKKIETGTHTATAGNGETIQAQAQPAVQAEGLNQQAGTIPGVQPMYISGGAGMPGQAAPVQNQQAPSASETAAKAKESQEDMQKAQSIYAEMAASRQKWMMQMWQIIQDTQTAIMQMMQDSALRRAKMMDTVAVKWAACLGGYELR